MGHILGETDFQPQVHTVSHWVALKSLRNILPTSQDEDLKDGKDKGLEPVGQVIQVPDVLQKHRNISSECAQNLRVTMSKILS